MPAYSFEKRFVEKILDGSKCCTFRVGKPKKGESVGRLFCGFYGLRSSQCRRLVESEITETFTGKVLAGGVYSKAKGENLFMQLLPRYAAMLAQECGFQSLEEMIDCHREMGNLGKVGRFIFWDVDQAIFWKGIDNNTFGRSKQ
jgi:hypothetical protein